MLSSKSRITFVLSILLLLLCVFSLNNTNAFSLPIKPERSSVQVFSFPATTTNEIQPNENLSKTNGASLPAAISTITTTATRNLIVKLLADNLENHLQQAGSILNVTSKLPQVRNTSYSYLLNQTLSTLHGIPQNVDIEKREVAQNMLSSNKDLFEVVFIMPNGDIYFDEPYSEQKILTTTNLAFRDYFQGAIRTNDTYLGNVITSVASPVREALIAIPVYSLKDNGNSTSTTIAGIWAAGINFNILSKELQSFNLTATASGMRAVYLDHNGNKVADSDVNKASTQESFA